MNLNYDPFSGFDPSKVEDKKPLELLPQGRYLVHVESFENKPIKNGESGSGTNFTIVVRDGEHVNRKIWLWLNMNHNDPKTKGWAEQEAKAMCNAIGIPKPLAIQAIFGKPFVVEVICKTDKDGEMRNKIKSYHPASEWNAVPSNAGAPAAVQRQAAQAYAQPQQQQTPAQGGGGTATATPAQQRPRGKQSWMG